MLVTNNSFHHPFGWSPSLKREALECDLSLSCYQLRKLWFFAIVLMGGSGKPLPYNRVTCYRSNFCHFRLGFGDPSLSFPPLSFLSGAKNLGGKLAQG